MAAAPAAAASPGALTVSVSTADMRVTASGQTQVTARVKSGTAPAAGKVVSFSGPSGSSFSPPAPTTDATGTATTTLTLGDPWAKPGSTVAVSAVAGSASASQGLTVTGANLLVAGSGYTSSFAQEALVFPSPVVQATGSDYSATYVLLADGTVWAKGRNGSGQLGDGTTTDSVSTWKQIPGLAQVAQIAAGGQSAYALLSDGTVRAWGSNASGQLGDGTTVDRYRPVPVLASAGTTLTGVAEISGGFSQCQARLSDGTVRSWGANDHGQLGVGPASSALYATGVVLGFDPTNPTQPSDSPLSDVVQISTGRWTTLALTKSGTVYAWGYNVNGSVGNGDSGDNADQRRAVKVLSGSPGANGTPSYLSNVTAVSAGSFSSYAILADKTVMAWGRNAYGELGSSRAGSQAPTPVAVDGLTDVVQIAGGREYVAALRSDGTVLTWGGNSSGQLGNGGTVQRSSPGSVTSLQSQTVARIGSLALGFATFLVTQV